MGHFSRIRNGNQRIFLFKPNLHLPICVEYTRKVRTAGIPEISAKAEKKVEKAIKLWYNDTKIEIGELSWKSD